DENQDEVVSLTGWADRRPGEALTISRDVWSWNGRRWQWCGQYGAVRATAGVVFDRARRELLQFFGTDAWDGREAVPGGAAMRAGTAPGRPTWEYYFEKQGEDWPPPRMKPATAFDQKRQVVVLFGGVLPDGTYLNDLWEWDGKRWHKCTAAGGPSPRSGA